MTFLHSVYSVSYYNLDLSVRLSVCLSVPHLLRGLWTDRYQTRQVHRGHPRKEPKCIGFHGNHLDQGFGSENIYFSNSYRPDDHSIVCGILLLVHFAVEIVQIGSKLVILWHFVQNLDYPSSEWRLSSMHDLTAPAWRSWRHASCCQAPMTGQKWGQTSHRRARDAISRDDVITSARSGPKSWVHTISNFSNRPIIKEDTAIFVKSCIINVS